MAIKLIKRQLVLFGLESGAYGSGATLTGTDALLVEEFAHNPAEQQAIAERLGITGSLSMPQKRQIGRFSGATFNHELVGGSAAGSPPPYGLALNVCGLIGSTDPGVSATFKPAGPSEAIASGAMDYWDGGADRHQIAGIRGNMTLALEGGDYGRFGFTMGGHAASPASAARATPSYHAGVPSNMKVVPVSVGGSALSEVFTANLDMQNTLSGPPSLTEDFNASGYAEYLITAMDPQLVLSMSARDIADGYDPYGDMDAGTARQVVIGPIANPNAGSILTVTMPSCTVVGVSEGDNEGRKTYDVTYNVAEETMGANDTFTLVYT